MSQHNHRRSRGSSEYRPEKKRQKVARKKKSADDEASRSKGRNDGTGPRGAFAARAADAAEDMEWVRQELNSLRAMKSQKDEL